MIQLSKRLMAVSSMVTEGNRLADVGTDHGYIPIYLCQKGHIPSAIAMDIGKGPLARAQEHIAKYELEERISTRLSDGVKALAPGEADSVVIAGMGGGLVQKILEEGKTVLDGISELILQPQSEIGEVRLYLQEHGYRITEEKMVLEDGKYYPMMHVIHGHMEPLSDVELKYGKNLLEQRHPVLKDYLEKERQNLEKIRENLVSISSEKGETRKREVEVLIEQNSRAQLLINTAKLEEETCFAEN